jgi:hypothetical protein
MSAGPRPDVAAQRMRSRVLILFKLPVRPLKRPEMGRSRRRLGVCPSLGWRTRRPRRQPVGWRAGADRAAATTGPQVVGGRGLAGCRPGRPGRRGQRPRRGRRASHLPSSVGVGGAQCAGPLLQAQGRFASQTMALRAALDLGASATLGQELWAGRWPAPHRVRAANPVTDSVRIGQGGVKPRLTPYCRKRELL